MLGTLEELQSFYRPGDERRIFAAGKPLLATAIGNTDPVNRFEIATFLLDQGADPTWSDRRAGGNLLHYLLNHVRGPGFRDTDFVLLRRLLDGGANVNDSAKGFGTPLQLLRRYANAAETNVAPLYDVFFARDDLDLFSPGKYKHSTYSSAWKTRDSKPILWQRVQQYVADHGLEVPESEQVTG